MKGLKGLVSGKVQGVWYRKAVQQGCQAIGLGGYAKNLPDGRVEVLLMGTAEQIDRGKEVVARGSPRSEVSHVEWLSLTEVPSVNSFVVL